MQVFPGKITVHINMKGCKENQLCLTSLFLDMKSPVFSQKMSVNPECERAFSLRKQPIWQDIVQQREQLKVLLVCFYHSLLKIATNASDFRSQAPSCYNCACSWL